MTVSSPWKYTYKHEYCLRCACKGGLKYILLKKQIQLFGYKMLPALITKINHRICPHSLRKFIVCINIWKWENEVDISKKFDEKLNHRYLAYRTTIYLWNHLAITPIIYGFQWMFTSRNQSHGIANLFTKTNIPANTLLILLTIFSATNKILPRGLLRQNRILIQNYSE